MIYLIFVHVMMHRMQITQECCECDLTINDVKFMQNKRLLRCQKVTVVFITNTYCSTPTW